MSEQSFGSASSVYYQIQRRKKKASHPVMQLVKRKIQIANKRNKSLSQRVTCFTNSSYLSILCANNPKKSEEGLFLFRDSTVLVDPVQYLSMPNQRVLRLEYPLPTCQHLYLSNMNIQRMLTYMMLIGEHDKLARHTASLKDVEHGQTLRDWQAIIELVMDYL